MVHSYFGGITAEGRLPRFNGEIDIFVPAEVLLTGEGEVLVTDGQTVCVGDMLYGGANPVYATVSGKVSLTAEGVSIRSDGEYTHSNSLVGAKKALEEFDRIEIASETSRYGIFDARQNAFLGDMLADCEKTERIIVNCCDPYFDGFATGAEAIAHTEELVGGITVLLYALDAVKAILCIDKRSDKLADTLKVATKGRRDITIAVIETKYPINDRTLVGAVYGKGVVPQKPINPAKHFVVSSSAVIQLYTSFVTGMPQVLKTFALCVEGSQSVNVTVPVGTAASDILERYSVENTVDTVICEGNPLCGVSRDRFACRISPSTDMIRVLTRREYYAGDCISCGKCNLACPMGLDTARLAKSGYMPHSRLCIHCGACEFVCPTRVDLMNKIALSDAAAAERDAAKAEEDNK